MVPPFVNERVCFSTLVLEIGEELKRRTLFGKDVSSDLFVSCGMITSRVVTVTVK